MQEEVTGISRSGRVRKKSSKLMDFESPDDIETRYRRQTPVKSYSNFRQEEPPEFQAQEPPTSVPVEEASTNVSGSDSDCYENNVETAESIESDSSQSDERGPTRQTPAKSLYMMEKMPRRRLLKDSMAPGKAKAQRKDKGKTRITAYMMWAKEARHEVIRKHPDMDFSAISRRLGEMWSNVNYNERYVWKRKAKRFALLREQSNHTTNKIISNSHMRPTSHAGPGRPPKARPRPAKPTSSMQTLLPISSVTALAAAAAPASALRPVACGPVEVAAHLRLLGESLAIIGERLKEHEGQIAVSGSVSVLLDTLLCSLVPLLGVCRAVPALAPPAPLLSDTLHNIAYIMPGL